MNVTLLIFISDRESLIVHLLLFHEANWSSSKKLILLSKFLLCSLLLPLRNDNVYFFQTECQLELFRQNLQWSSFCIARIFFSARLLIPYNVMKLFSSSVSKDVVIFIWNGILLFITYISFEILLNFILFFVEVIRIPWTSSLIWYFQTSSILDEDESFDVFASDQRSYLVHIYDVLQMMVFHALICPSMRNIIFIEFACVGHVRSFTPIIIILYINPSFSLKSKYYYSI